MGVPYSDIRAEYMDRPNRKVLDLRRNGLADIPSLGWCNYRFARPDLPVHHHFGVWELHLLEQGNLEFEVEGEPYRLHGGDLFVTQPGESHSTGGAPVEPCTLYWLQVRIPKRGRPLLQLPPKESARLITTLRTLPARHFRGSSQVKALFDRLLNLHSNSQTPFRITRMRQGVVELLLEVADCSMCRADADQTSVLHEIAAMIRARPAENFHLKDLARRAHMSLSWFTPRFKEHTGLTPGQFILRARIEAACLRLRNGNESITRISGDVGFETSQHFATAFKRITGVSPRTYRQKGPEQGSSHRREDGQR